MWTTLLYGSETWTLRKEDIRKLEALEMWLWGTEKISWTDRVTNEEDMGRVEGGHIVRNDDLLMEVIEGRMVEKRYQGSPRLGMFDEVNDDTTRGFEKKGRRSINLEILYAMDLPLGNALRER